jgi:arylsulfatase A-like enzyme
MYKNKKLTERPNEPKSEMKWLLQYYAMTTSLDTCMGRINDALQSAGISKDTIVVFTSDHGDMMGSQGHQKKQRPWEEAINIPFIIRYPNKITAGQIRDYSVSSVDVMPTLLGLCDIAIPTGVEGWDYSATFRGESEKQRDAAFLFNVHHGSGPKTDWRGIRTKEWVYAYHFSGDWVMYDLKNDTYQLKNLIDDQKYAEKKKELKMQVDEMRRSLGESLPLKGKMPQPIQLPE